MTNQVLGRCDGQRPELGPHPSRHPDYFGFHDLMVDWLRGKRNLDVEHRSSIQVYSPYPDRPTPGLVRLLVGIDGPTPIRRNGPPRTIIELLWADDLRATKAKAEHTVGSRSIQDYRALSIALRDALDQNPVAGSRRSTEVHPRDDEHVAAGEKPWLTSLQH
jgi:hypothetical protein